MATREPRSINETRVPPHSVEAEDSLVGAMLLSRDAISEAVELATSLSTDQSPSFVNGLLGRLLQMKPSLVD